MVVQDDSAPWLRPDRSGPWRGQVGDRTAEATSRLDEAALAVIAPWGSGGQDQPVGRKPGEGVADRQQRIGIADLAADIALHLQVRDDLLDPIGGGGNRLAVVIAPEPQPRVERRRDNEDVDPLTAADSSW